MPWQRRRIRPVRILVAPWSFCPREQLDDVCRLRSLRLDEGPGRLLNAAQVDTKPHNFVPAQNVHFLIRYFQDRREQAIVDSHFADIAAQFEIERSQARFGGGPRPLADVGDLARVNSNADPRRHVARLGPDQRVDARRVATRVDAAPARGKRLPRPLQCATGVSAFSFTNVRDSLGDTGGHFASTQQPTDGKRVVGQPAWRIEIDRQLAARYMFKKGTQPLERTRVELAFGGDPLAASLAARVWRPSRKIEQQRRFLDLDMFNQFGRARLRRLRVQLHQAGRQNCDERGTAAHKCPTPLAPAIQACCRSVAGSRLR